MSRGRADGEGKGRCARRGAKDKEDEGRAPRLPRAQKKSDASACGWGFLGAPGRRGFRRVDSTGFDSARLLALCQDSCQRGGAPSRPGSQPCVRAPSPTAAGVCCIRRALIDPKRRCSCSPRWRSALWRQCLGLRVQDLWRMMGEGMSDRADVEPSRLSTSCTSTPLRSCHHAQGLRPLPQQTLLPRL